MRPVSLQTAIEATSARLDELGAARAIANAAELVHKAQGGQVALATLMPAAIEIDADGEVSLGAGRGAGGPAAPAQYQSPEKLRGEKGDRRSDVWALGVILWEALARETLFEGGEAAAKAAILAGVVGPPSESNANIPAELDAICKKALALDPGNRYSSCKVMAAELAAVLDDAGYPEDNSQLAAFVAAARATAPAPAVPAAAIAATPVTPTPVVPAAPVVAAPSTPSAAAKKALNQTMLGVAPIVVEVARAEAAKAAAAKAEAAQAEAAKPVEAARPKSASIPPIVQPLASDAAPKAGDTPSSVAAAVSAATSAQAANARTKSPTVPPAVQPLASDARPKTPSAQPATIAAEAPRAKTPSKDAGRKKSPTGRHATSLPGWATGKGEAEAPKPEAPVVAEVPKAEPVKAPNPLSQTMIGVSTAAREPAPAAASEAALRSTAVGSASLAEALAKLNAASPAGTQSTPPELLGIKEPPKAAAVAPGMELPSLPPGATDEVVDVKPPTIANAVTVETPSLLTATAKGSPAGPSVLASPPPAAPESLAADAAGAMKAVVDAGASDPAAPTVPTDGKRPRSPTGRGSGSAKAVDPVDAVSLPRKRNPSQGDQLAGWEWKGDGSDAAGFEEDADLEDKQKQKKFLIFGIGGAAVVLLLVVIIARAMGGGGDKKVDKKVSAVDTEYKATPPDPGSAVVAAVPADAAVEIDAAAEIDAEVAAMIATPPDAPVIEIDAPPPIDATPLPPPVDAAPPPPPAPDAAVPEVKKPDKTKPDLVAKPDKTKPDKTKPDKTKPDKTKPDKTSGPVDPYATTPVKSDPAADYKKGIGQFAKGDLSGALSTLQQSAVANPDYAPTWRGIGLVQEKMGNNGKAKSAFKKYLKLSPNSSDAAQIKERMEKL